MSEPAENSQKKLEIPQKRELPKLMACMTKTSLENLRNKALFALDILDKKGIRRRKFPLYECLVLEMREAGFSESSDYLRDLIYDNEQIMAEDEIGIVVDIKKREDYLVDICKGLQRAEKEREKGNTKQECVELLNLALYFSEREKGILWLAEKLFLASIAVSSKYLLDGGRQKAVCKYYYAKFLLDKFPGADPEEEAFVLLAEVRDGATGKIWRLLEQEEDDQDSTWKLLPKDTVFGATALQLHRVLLSKARLLRKEDTGKAERLARLAERRARDANESTKIAEAIVEIGICQLQMNNLNNAQKTFEKAFKIYVEKSDIEGICVTKMHMAAVCQKMRDHEKATRLLTEMGALAMRTGLRLQLGRALNLLGELHLRREHPEFGTQHLAEAFSCFMGHLVTENEMGEDELESFITVTSLGDTLKSDLGVVFEGRQDKEVYLEEAEQSRLMMAISAGQEMMASYFGMVNQAKHCAVAQLKIIEWKMDAAGWWIQRQHHDYLPCMCKQHNRTPLDVVKMKLRLQSVKSMKSVYSTFSLLYAELNRVATVHDIRQLRSSYHKSKDLAQNTKTESTMAEEVVVDIEEEKAGGDNETNPNNNVQEEEKDDEIVSQVSIKEEVTEM